MSSLSLRDAHSSGRAPDHRGVLIIGASQAGVQLAASLREFGWTESITLLGAETHPPYQRPPLSKKALHDGIVASDLALRSEQFFTDKGIDLVLGERVTTLDVSNAGHGTAVTSAGRRLSFGRLALTVGARPRRLDLPGAELGGIYYLRNSTDAVQLRSALVDTPRIVVIGGGFIGLEVAATARLLGCEVTVVLSSNRLMARAVSPSISAHVQAVHEGHNVNIRYQSAPVAFHGNGRVRGVQLADGTILPADVVIVGVGAEPRTELAEQIDLTVSDGIVVDQHGLTSDGVTVAAGDCAVWHGSIPGMGGSTPGSGVRFESVNAATEQAKVAAATITGQPKTWSSTPWFWSDQFDLKLQVAGSVPTGGSHVVRQDDAGITVLHYSGKRLIAAECINRPADFMVARAAITKGQVIDATRAGDTAISLKSLITQGNPVGAAFSAATAGKPLKLSGLNGEGGIEGIAEQPTATYKVMAQ
ncbi:NAD(P)/FAD-dependent oxidoreductase [Arthrobacter sp. TMT4-20]